MLFDNVKTASDDLNTFADVASNLGALDDLFSVMWQISICRAPHIVKTKEIASAGV
jgi:hypothetical protein